MFEATLEATRQELLKEMTRAIDDSYRAFSLTDDDWDAIYAEIEIDAYASVWDDNPVVVVIYGRGDNDHVKMPIEKLFEGLLSESETGDAAEYDKMADLLEDIAKKLRTAPGRVTP